MGEVDRWANIPSDLLFEISKQLYSFHDYMRLRSVCKAWRSMVPKIPEHNRNPWLVLPNVDEKTALDTRRLEEEGIYHLMLPGMQDNIIRGSGHGWLLFYNDSDGTMGTMNPFTKARLDLPPISALPSVLSYNPDLKGEEYTCLYLREDANYTTTSECCTITQDEHEHHHQVQKVVVSSYPPDSNLPDYLIYTRERVLMHKYELFKVVISSPPEDDDFMAVAIYGECCRLAFYKHHDSRWRDIATPNKNPDFEDVIFFRERMYAVNFDAQLYEFDIKTKAVPVGGISEAVASPPEIVGRYNNPSMNKYLIGCANGNLLMLVKHLDASEDSHLNTLEGRVFYQAYRWDIFKLNRSAREWSRVYSLGDDYVAMIGYSCSVQIWPHTFSHDGKGDHIYYTDNQVELHSHDFPSPQDIGIFNLKDASAKNNLLLSAKFLCPPVWLSVP